MSEVRQQKSMQSAIYSQDNFGVKRKGLYQFEYEIKKMGNSNLIVQKTYNNIVVFRFINITKIALVI